MDELKTHISPIMTGSFLDYPSKDGMCLSLYFSGCAGLCPECQNKELQDPNYGEEFSISKLINIISIETKRLRTNKITLLGGDPLFITNIDFVRELLNKTHTYYDYCIYTGYPPEYVASKNIRHFKFLKTGYYDQNLAQESLKTDRIFQLASKNQEIYDKDYCCLTINGRMYFN